jgi:hypothetical protein
MAGGSTVQLQDVVDVVSSMADVSPQAKPSGYAETTTLAIGDDVMNELLSAKFNWKWNSKNAAPFYTNSLQQDYPLPMVYDIGWIEDGLWVDINNTAKPQPNGQVVSAQDLAPARSNYSQYPGAWPRRVCWIYNKQMLFGTWPGPASVYTPPITAASQIQNGPTAFIDKNGNILLLTTFGTTGATQPYAATAGAQPGSTINDGTCVWTVCDPEGKGFRIQDYAPPTGPVYQVTVKYQKCAQRFTALQNSLAPIPDDYAHYFRKGYKAYSYGYSDDAKTRSQFEQMKKDWLASIPVAMQEGNREPEAFGLYPETRIVEPTIGWTRNPRDPGRPW